MAEYYSAELNENDEALTVPLKISADDTDLYWRLALDMYQEIVSDIEAGRPTVFIVPVGPVYQYRRLVELFDALPIHLGNLHLFFMDEYLDSDDRCLQAENPLCFRGFIERELVDLLDGRHGFKPSQVYFPDPEDPAAYDAGLESLGGATVCYAGVGINGHLAFNEAPSASESPSRIVNLTAETITTNAHTALGGAYESIPRRAVTVGMKSILASRRLSIWMNRPWQKVVVRKLLFGDIGSHFPASFARTHGNVDLNITATVAEPPQFALR